MSRQTRSRRGFQRDFLHIFFEKPSAKAIHPARMQANGALGVAAALGCQLTRNIYSEVGYRYLYGDFRDEGANDFLYQMSLHGAQISVGLNF
jgi:hypothetical protein